MPSAKRIRSTALAAASRSGPSARRRTPPPAGHARTTHRLVVHVQQPRERAFAAPHHAVAPAAGHPKRAGGHHVALDVAAWPAAAGAAAVSA